MQNSEAAKKIQIKCNVEYRRTWVLSTVRKKETRASPMKEIITKWYKLQYC